MKVLNYTWCYHLHQGTIWLFNSLPWKIPTINGALVRKIICFYMWAIYTIAMVNSQRVLGGSSHLVSGLWPQWLTWDFCRVNPLIIGVITHLRAVGWATKYRWYWPTSYFQIFQVSHFSIYFWIVQVIRPWLSTETTMVTGGSPILIWGFPEIGVPPVIIHVCLGFSLK